PSIGGEFALDVNFVSLSRETSQFRAADPLDPDARGVFGGIYDTCAPDAFNRDQCLLPGVAGSYSRLTSQVSWRRQIIDGLGQSWTPFAYLRADGIWSSPRTGGFQNAETANLMGSSDRFHGRMMPGAGLEYRMPMIARAGNFGVQSLEPIAQIVARPNETRIGRLPNEDAQSLVFDDSNLFSWDRFSGYDRVEGGVRGSYALRYGLTGHDGFRAEAKFGQSVQLAGRNSFRPGDLVNTGRDSGLESRFSDYVGRVSLSPNEIFSVNARGRFDRSTFDMKRLEAGASLTFDRIEGSVSYARFAPQPELGYPDRREGLQLSGRVELSPHWFASGSVMFDLSRHLEDRRRGVNESDRFSVASMSVGLGYADECTYFTVTYSSRPKDGSLGSRDQNRTVMLQLELRSLGGVGVKQSIEGRTQESVAQ
ncbi:MAG: LPS-assembly protein LptD, partial [Salinarimonas sp.]|nr:LPS-assembly protein LptD [Salinarimonas sp.]